MKRVLSTMLVLACAAAGAQTGAGAGNLVDKVQGQIAERSIEQLLVDSAEAQVSAASLIGFQDQVSVVQNVRDFSLLLGAFDRQAQSLGLAITPARTRFPFPRIRLQDYGQPDAHLTRLLGSLTLSYAQGKSGLDGRDFLRRAVSVATSGYFRASDDPVVAVAAAAHCGRAATDALADAGADAPAFTMAQLAEFVRLERLDIDAAAALPAAVQELQDLRQRAAAGQVEAQRQLKIVDGYALRRRAKAGEPDAIAAVARDERAALRLAESAEKSALQAFNACADAVLEAHGRKWNRSGYSLSWATGSVKPTDGREPAVSLGRTLALSMLYGFDHVPALSERAAVSLTWRDSRREPVLTTLGTAAVATRDERLWAVRLSGGSSTLRVLAEGSQRKGREPTTSTATLRRALGIDYRVAEGLWLNLRYGRQRKLDGSGDETGSFLILNYSPGATLGR
ncbi:MAG: hypothetical protein KF683_23860 [Rubrivivax sp.]|nr:hypothetical protein [Rubrivivax sp.]